MTNFSLLGLGRHVARSENLRGRTTPPASPLPTYVSTVSFRGPQKQESKNNQSFAIFGQNMNYIRNDVVMINITF